MIKNTAIQGICCIQKAFNISYIVLSYACWITNHPKRSEIEWLSKKERLRKRR
jgi:hypothetical protein